jgi:hypothetical protein
MPKRYIVETGPSSSSGMCTVKFRLDKPDTHDTCPDLPSQAVVPTQLCDALKAGPQDPAGWSCAELRRILGLP